MVLPKSVVVCIEKRSSFAQEILNIKQRKKESQHSKITLSSKLTQNASMNSHDLS